MTQLSPKMIETIKEIVHDADFGNNYIFSRYNVNTVRALEKRELIRFMGFHGKFVEPTAKGYNVVDEILENE